jgi:hypothetical protein
MVKKPFRYGAGKESFPAPFFIRSGQTQDIFFAGPLLCRCSMTRCAPQVQFILAQSALSDMEKIPMKKLSMLVLSLTALVSAVSGAEYGNDSALKGIKVAKAIFDVNAGDLAKLEGRPRLIDLTYNQLIASGVTPTFRVAFRGPASRLAWQAVMASPETWKTNARCKNGSSISGRRELCWSNAILPREPSMSTPRLFCRESGWSTTALSL